PHPPSGNNSPGPHVVHNRRTVPYPRIGTDRHARVCAALQPDRHIEAIEVMLPLAAQDIDVGADQRVITDGDMSDHALGADVDVLADIHLRGCEECAEPDRALRGTAS